VPSITAEVSLSQQLSHGVTAEFPRIKHFFEWQKFHRCSKCAQYYCGSFAVTAIITRCNGRICADQAFFRMAEIPPLQQMCGTYCGGFSAVVASCFGNSLVA